MKLIPQGNTDTWTVSHPSLVTAPTPCRLCVCSKLLVPSARAGIPLTHSKLTLPPTLLTPSWVPRHLMQPLSFVISCCLVLLPRLPMGSSGSSGDAHHLKDALSLPVLHAQEVCPPSEAGAVLLT